MADHIFPILLVVRQEKQVLSWQVPMVVKKREGMEVYNSTARTLCYTPDEYIKTYYRGAREKIKRFSISLSTSSLRKLNITLQVQEVFDYYIKDYMGYSTTISPSMPSFYFYNYEEKQNINSVFVRLESNYDVCVTVSVQNSLCPVRDLNNNIEYEGKYQEMSRKAGLTLRKKEFPNGFFLVFVAKPDNWACSQESVILSKPNTPVNQLQHLTTIHFKVQPASSRSVLRKAVLIIFGSYIGFCLLVVGVVLLFYRFGNLRKIKMENNWEENADTTDGNVPHVGSQEIIQQYEIKLNYLVQNMKLNDTKSYNYCWHVMNVGLFYGIPVVQLMISYQRVRISF